MKLAPARLAGFLRAPDPAARVILVYGPDAGLVRERADILARTVSPDLADPFRVAELAAGALAGDPARLHDEAAAMSLVGGRRVVRLREAGDGIAALVERFLAAPPPGDSLIVIEAGELPARSSLRRAVEASPRAVAVACYADGPREIEALTREVLGAHRVTATPEAMQYLLAHLGGDRGVSRQELEKLALYAGDGGRVDGAAAMAAVGDTAALDLDDVIFAAADGDAAAMERALQRAMQEGQSPVTIVRAAMRHFQRLQLAAARVAEGTGADEAVRGLRPPLFFKLADRFKGQLRLWPPRRAARVLELLTEAEVNLKRTGPPPETICHKALLDIARHAAAARARRA